MPKKRKDLKIEGVDLWYLVGLIASDGCLSTDGRHIDITSNDCNFLQSIVNKLRLSNKVTEKSNTKGQKSFHIQIGNRNFYDFLLSIGLIQNKSLTLNRITIPDKYFVDFLRGLIDGDGCIRFWKHPSNHNEQWSLRIYSGSQQFVTWLQSTIEWNLKCRGKIHSEIRSTGKNAVYTLKYGKIAARQIFGRCYYPNAFGLERKKDLAAKCLLSCRGWSQSKTILN